MSSTSRRPRRGDRLEVTIEGLDAKGRGVAQAGRYLVAARGALPGARVVVEVSRARGAGVDARVAEVLDPGPDLVDPACPHETHCGGCSFQRLAYPRQLEYLHARVTGALAKVGFDTPVEPVVGMQHPFGYRNKMEYTFGGKRFREAHEPAGTPDDFALGLHVPGWHEKVIDLESCAIHFEGADEVVAAARELAVEQGLSVWDLEAHTGLLRYLVLRKGMRTGELLANLVTSEDAPELVDRYAAALQARCPEITTIVQSVNTRAASTALGERERVLAGPGVIHEEVGGLTYAISAQSFFQTNTLQAERLFAAVREEAALTGAERVLDLYCGAGTIGLALADQAASVCGYEVIEPAVVDARQNAERNGITNATFVAGDVGKTLAAEEPPQRPDLVVVDPPRAGLEPRMVPAVVRLGAARVVYVSCNIDAAARDLSFLRTGGYRLERVRPFDLFPHTPHVEVVLTLVREATA